MIRLKNFQYYYDSLCYSIKELGADPEKMYPKNAFHVSFYNNIVSLMLNNIIIIFQDELKIYSKFGLGFSLESVPFTLMKNDDAPDLDMIEVNLKKMYIILIRIIVFKNID